jgi:TonB family protein
LFQNQLLLNTSYRRVSGPASLAIHAIAIAALMLLTRVARVPMGHSTPITSAVDAGLIVPFAGGAGGGGGQDKLPASQGELPPLAPEQFAPPQVELANPDPVLPVIWTLLGPRAPGAVDVNKLGDPHGVEGPRSDGPGTNSGIGRGNKGGIGDDEGPRYGDGDGPWSGTHRVGTAGVVPPRLVHKVEPEYTEAARKVRYQGTVSFEAIIGADGRVKRLRLRHAIGLGLDEKAEQAVLQWRFLPGTKDGVPVDVIAQIEVSFRLL